MFHKTVNLTVCSVMQTEVEDPRSSVQRKENDGSLGCGTLVETSLEEKGGSLGNRKYEDSGVGVYGRVGSSGRSRPLRVDPRPLIPVTRRESSDPEGPTVVHSGRRTVHPRKGQGSVSSLSPRKEVGSYLDNQWYTFKTFLLSYFFFFLLLITSLVTPTGDV